MFKRHEALLAMEVVKDMQNTLQTVHVRVMENEPEDEDRLIQLSGDIIALNQTLLLINQRYFGGAFEI